MYGLKWTGVLGYVVAVMMIAAIIWAGQVFINTDGQLAVILTGMTGMILIMGIITVYMRMNRITKREYDRTFGARQYNPMENTERRFLQLTSILLVSMVLLGVIQKGPKVLRLAENMVNSWF